MSIREMQDKVVRKFGFEDKNTIEFFIACENFSMDFIRMLFNSLMIATIMCKE